MALGLSVEWPAGKTSSQGRSEAIILWNLKNTALGGPSVGARSQVRNASPHEIWHWFVRLMLMVTQRFAKHTHGVHNWWARFTRHPELKKKTLRQRQQITRRINSLGELRTQRTYSLPLCNRYRKHSYWIWSPLCLERNWWMCCTDPYIIACHRRWRKMKTSSSQRKIARQTIPKIQIQLQQSQNSTATGPHKSQPPSVPTSDASEAFVHGMSKGYPESRIVTVNWQVSEGLKLVPSGYLAW